MKQSIVLALAIIAAAAMMVPMSGVVAEDGVYIEDASSPTTVGDELPIIDDTSDNRSIGVILMVVLFSLFMLIIFLEHKGILKDPMLY